MTDLAWFATGYLAALGSVVFAWVLGNRILANATVQTSEVLPEPRPVTYVDAIHDTPGATWVDQVVAVLADHDELTLAHELRSRVDRALATLRALARPDHLGNPCWCPGITRGPHHARVCTTAATTVSSLSAPPFPRPTVVPDLGRYHH